MKQITKKEAFEAIKGLFDLSDMGKREEGKSFYAEKENGDVTFMFDKRQYWRDEVVSKLAEYFQDKNIVGGQVRIDSITFVWTAVYLEDRKQGS